MTQVDTVIIGGGFFGLRLASLIGKVAGGTTFVLERESALMTRASANNQARVHNGYHYPRSVKTASSSHANYLRFTSEFRDCVDSTNLTLYAVGARQSQISQIQFECFCQRLGLPLRTHLGPIASMINRSLIKELFEVEEAVFNFELLRKKLVSAIEADHNIKVRLNSQVCRVSQRGSSWLVELSCGETMLASKVFNVSYSDINQLLATSGIPPLAIKVELAEVCLIEMPSELRTLGLTVMDGPFFSTLPFPAFGLHSLTHVRYTPHLTWMDSVSDSERLRDRASLTKSRFRFMMNDAARYLPPIATARYQKSLFEYKAVPKRTEDNDARPIGLKVHCAEPLFASVLGAKIDNVFDLELAVAELL